MTFSMIQMDTPLFAHRLQFRAGLTAQRAKHPVSKSSSADDRIEVITAAVVASTMQPKPPQASGTR